MQDLPDQEEGASNAWWWLLWAHARSCHLPVGRMMGDNPWGMHTAQSSTHPSPPHPLALRAPLCLTPQELIFCVMRRAADLGWERVQGVVELMVAAQPAVVEARWGRSCH